MRHLLLLTIVILINSVMSVSGQSSTLNDILWHKRLIVAFTAESSLNASLFTEHVNAAACDLAERDVDVYLIDNTAAKALTRNSKPLDIDSIGTLQTSRQDSTLGFEMILIGKYGGTKAYSLAPHELQLFLDLIDGMPMRRAEAAQQMSKC